MAFLSFLDRTKPVYILAACCILIAINLSVNMLLNTSGSLAIFNGAFEVTFSTLVTVFLFLIYTTAKKNDVVFSRTLIWMALAMSAWSVGDAIYLYYICIKVDPFISPSDVFYIGATLLTIASVLTIPGTQPPSHRRNMVFVEISILVLSATVLFTSTILLRGKPDLSYDLFTLLMVFVYPVLDIVLLWLIIIIYFAYPVKSSQKVLGIFFAGALFIFSSDLYYLFSSLYGPLSRDYLVDVGYYVFYLMMLLAALAGFKNIRQRISEEDKKTNAFKSGNWIVFIPGVFLILVIGFLLVFVLNQSFILSNGVIILIAFIIILFILHQYMVIADNIKLTKEMRQINEQLEKKVEQRTAELSEANSELQEEMKERERAEEHLARSNQDLALMNRDKDKLFSILAHDLRNPLGSMMNLTDLMIENIRDFDESELMEIIATLNKSATQTFQLFNDLLAWSAVQMGRGEREKELFPVEEVVSETLVILASEAERKQIAISTEIDKEVMAFADKFAIQTVVRNLLSNAVKFTPLQGNVTIKAEKYTEFVKISVIDTGIGIAREKLKRIFRVDSVSSSPGTDGEKGTGFGLLLCKDLIERNDGKIWIESEKGKGSTFIFTLPLNSNENDSPTASRKLPATRIQSTYDHLAKITFTTMSGEINLRILRSELSLIWSSTEYNPDYSVLVDLRYATFDLDTNDIPEVLEIFSAMPGKKKNRKFALLTATPQQVALSTMFGQNIKARYPFIVEVFSTQEAALNWLGM